MNRFELHLGDCLELMRTLPDASVDMILCDLPYGTTACAWDSVIPFEPLWAEYRRIAKPHAAIVLHAAQPFTTALIASNMREFRYNWVWVKNTQTGIALAGKQPMRKHEDICVFYRGRGTFNAQMRETDSAIMKQHAARGYGRGENATKSDHNPGMELHRKPFSAVINPATVLQFDVVPNRSRERVHPTQKPIDLVEYLVRTYTNEGDVVLDNCMGSGTTGVACANTGRRFIGMEMDAGYFAIAQQRIMAAVPQAANDNEPCKASAAA
jgi:site-specific DNA-methyltransferase (adenine-specific)